MYSESWELGTPKGLSKTALNSEVVVFLRSISIYWIGIGTEVAVLNSQVVPISQVVLKTGFTVYNKLFSQACVFICQEPEQCSSQDVTFRWPLLSYV